MERLATDTCFAEALNRFASVFAQRGNWTDHFEAGMQATQPPSGRTVVIETGSKYARLINLLSDMYCFKMAETDQVLPWMMEEVRRHAMRLKDKEDKTPLRSSCSYQELRK
jgi:hypothetical protein